MPTQLAHPSPKRKRDHALSVPLLNTTLRLATPIPPQRNPSTLVHPDSPRNEVADRLQSMTLDSIAAIPMSPLTPTDEVIRKKPRLDEMRVDSVLSLHAQLSGEDELPQSPSNHESLEDLAVKSPVERAREIPETPQLVQPRMDPDIASFAQHHQTTFESSPVSATARSHLGFPDKTHAQHRPSNSQSARPRNRSPSPPLSALTWKDSEITGHLAGPSTDPDDDGTGINGIGFKPTPAMAYARSQKRRQQINEWRARETREARAKRSERRKLGMVGIMSTSSSSHSPLRDQVMLDRGKLGQAKKMQTARRTVKFAL